MSENTAVATVDRFRALVTSPKMVEAMKAVLPRHLTPDRMARLVLGCAVTTPKLRQCTPESITMCMMAASETGLEPGGSLGHCYIIPYGDKATFLIGYRGMIDLARRSGQLKSIDSRVVYKADKFVCTFGLEPRLEHIPAWDSERNDTDIIAAYAVAHLLDGATQMDVMTRPEIDAIRKRSRASGSGPWVTDYSEMCRKTVVRRLFKYLPSSPEIAKALEYEDTTQGYVESAIIEDAADNALKPGRHEVKGKAKAKATPEPEPEGEKVTTHEFDRDSALAEIESAINEDKVKPSDFDRMCAGIGIDDPTEWMDGTDAKIEALVLKIRAAGK